MIVTDKPPLDEALLAHYGVKGMHWGVRKDESHVSPGSRIKNVARNHPKTTKVVAASAAGVGVGVGLYLLNKNGHLPISNFSTSAVTKSGESAAAKLMDHPAPPATHSELPKNYLESKILRKNLPDDMYLRYDNAKGQYVQDSVWGWNPNTNKFGRQDWSNFNGD